jgi:hypothetical protein
MTGLQNTITEVEKRFSEQDIKQKDQTTLSTEKM